MSSNDRRRNNLEYPVPKKQFDTLTWANGEGHASQDTVMPNINMLVTRIDVLINQPTNNNTVNVTFADENGVAVIDPTNFTTLADGTDHMLLSTNIPADFSTVTLNNTITCSVDPSADSGATSLTVKIIFYGV